MTRTFLMLVLMGMVLSGCGEEKSPERTEPFQPSAPPPGYVEDRLKKQSESMPENPKAAGEKN
jgi:hypothetical protein